VSDSRKNRKDEDSSKTFNLTCFLVSNHILIKLEVYSMSEDEVKGEAEKMKGKATETMGKATGDAGDQAKGKAEQASGEVKKQVGKAEEKM
jgi:uncharacterized protein YjbJ (UPF0337 family)